MENISNNYSELVRYPMLFQDIENINQALQSIPLRKINEETVLTAIDAFNMLLRWYNQDLQNILIHVVGPNQPKIDRLHKTIIGGDGYLKGHSHNILRLAIESGLPKELCIIGYLHDLGEVGLLKKGRNFDFPTGQKNKDNKKYEAGMLKTILYRAGYNKQQINCILNAAEKKEGDEYGDILRKLEEYNFCKMHDQFVCLLKDGLESKRVDIFSTLQSSNNEIDCLNGWQLEWKTDAVIALYLDHLSQLTKEISSKSFFAEMQALRGSSSI